METEIWYICKYCKRCYKEAKDLILHKRNQHPEQMRLRQELKILAASKMRLETSNSEELTPEKSKYSNQQMQSGIKGEPEVIQYKCTRCSKSYFNDNHLTTHNLTHLEIKIHKYDLHEESYQKQAEPPTNMRLHYNKLQFDSRLKNPSIDKKCEKVKKKKIACETCNKIYPSSSSLRRHIIIHTEEKPFRCKICNTGFADKTNFIRPIRIHPGERPFICKICNRRFDRKSYLARHIKIHTSKRGFICKVCNKGFKRKSHLAYHITIHTGQRPFICKICNKGFNRNDHLDNHIAIHTGEKLFICNTCNKAFNRKSHLARHIKIHNKRKTVQL